MASYVYIVDAYRLSTLSNWAWGLAGLSRYTNGRPLRLETGGITYHYRYNAPGHPSIMGVTDPVEFNKIWSSPIPFP